MKEEENMCPPSASPHRESSMAVSPGRHVAPPVERLISARDLQGSMAFWATVQHPFRDPPKLARMVALVQEWAEHDFDALGTFCTRWFPSCCDLYRWLDERCVFSQEATAILTEWNTPRSQHKAQYVFSSCYDSPAPEHDFIDIAALTNNVCRMAWEQAAEYERTMQHSGEPETSGTVTATEGSEVTPNPSANPT